MARNPKSLHSQVEGLHSWQDVIFRYLLRFQRFARDLFIIFLISLAAITALALPGWTSGALITPLAELLRRWMGAAGILVVAGLVYLAVSMLRPAGDPPRKFPWGRLLAFEAAVFAGMVLLSVINGVSLERTEAGLDGGLIGWGLAEFLNLAMGPLLRAALLVMILLLGLVIGFGQLGALLNWMARQLEGSTASRGADLPDQAVTRVPVAAEPHSRASISPQPAKPVEGRPSLGLDRLRKKTDAKALPPEFRKKFRLPAEEKPSAPAPQRDADLPSLDLLLSGRANRPNERHINLTAGLIEKTLADFGIPVKVTGFQVGPTITQFALEPGYLERPGPEGEMIQQKVRVSQISSLSRDLALALSADRLRIQAPVPGRAFIGIEVPNANASVVRLRPILESESFYQLNSPLGMALGLDVSGSPVVADLSAMPHLLIAGTTGSGKSVCISAITTSLAMNNSPEDLRLVLIDPKKVELVRFNGLPHLMGKVETDLERILGVLRWVVTEMDRRYKLLEKHRSRNIDTFNKKMKRLKRPPEPTMPRIVVLIDELADLMMSAAEQTEQALVRLAQLARATGIHLIIATQRPSTDVVTGLIKANFPARLAFAVASSIDSRVILDTVGAESLLGNGDLLFLPPEAPAPIRAQGALVTDAELGKLIHFWQEQYGDGQEAPPWDEMMAEEAILADRDDLVEKAIEIVRATQRASASMLQRRLRVGYPRAARLIDELEDLGVIGPSQGSGRERDVLIDRDERQA